MEPPSHWSTTTQSSIFRTSRQSARLVDRWNRYSNRYRLEILLAAVTFVSIFAVALAIGALWLRDDSTPSIRVLGSGSRLSLLVVSGNSRLLTASGDDASAFGNALAQARHPTNRRLDVVIVAGNDRDMAVAKKAAGSSGARSIFLIDGPLAARFDDLGLDRDHVIAKPMSIVLPGEIEVTVAPAASHDGRWSAVIRRGITRVFAGNDDHALTRSEPLSAAVLTDGSGTGIATERSGMVIVVPSRTVTVSTLRDSVTGRRGSAYALRIQPAECATLAFAEGGLRLPETAIQIASESQR